jgi:hypothetical protein
MYSRDTEFCVSGYGKWNKGRGGLAMGADEASHQPDVTIQISEVMFLLCVFHGCSYGVTAQWNGFLNGS